MTVEIYALSSSRERESVRYVGQTRLGAEQRRRVWIGTATNDYYGPVNDWIRGELGEGATIVSTVLEECPDDDAGNAAEIAWIDRLRDEGHLLLNTEPGGGYGAPGVGQERWRRERYQKHLRRHAEPNEPEDGCEWCEALWS